MKRYVILILAFTICVVYPRFVHAENADDPNNEEEKVVTIELTKLDVNDTNLELAYKIKNKTDDDVWICDSINTESTFNFELYLDKDAKTLVLMKRFDIVPELEHPAPLKGGRYVRMRPAQEYFETLSLDVPVGPSLLYIARRANAEFATRLVIEIGFYNADVFQRIRSMIEVGERFNYTGVEIMDFQSDIMRRYFKGLLVTRLFGGLSHFDEVYINTDANELLMSPTYGLIDEQVLRIEVDGVHIRYDELASPYSPYPPHPKGKTCFLAETPVWVDGKIVPISKVVAGQVISRAPYTTRGSCLGHIEEVQEHTGTFECRDIVLESGNHIGVVGNHCFMLANDKWIAAQDLKSGLSLRTLQGTIKIKSVTVRAAPYTGKVYNLKIKNSDEYIVGSDAVIVRDY